MNLENELKHGSRLSVVYDGDCPLCSAYVTMTRIRDAVGMPTLVNARERPDLVRALARSGVDLDSGMAVDYEGRTYAGGEAMHLLELLSEPSGPFDRLTSALLRRRSVALWVYPAFRSGRNLLLKLRNRPPPASRTVTGSRHTGESRYPGTARRLYQSGFRLRPE